MLARGRVGVDAKRPGRHKVIFDVDLDAIIARRQVARALVGDLELHDAGAIAAIALLAPKLPGLENNAGVDLHRQALAGSQAVLRNANSDRLRSVREPGSGSTVPEGEHGRPELARETRAGL